ncbi:hypothetical protein D3OALGB2SA_4220 [Olavius algarvensis associated proteobacterium Delta 3]|nr:hypothetical protein D3OALGB2SA_4220 [Olavius algarvensis associated proteobacterium Delta 3]
MTAESQRTQRNCIFPRIPERGLLGKGPINILKFYTFLPDDRFALRPLSEMQNQYLLCDLCGDTLIVK